MLQRKFKNTFNKSRSYKKRCKYERQHNFSVDLLRKTIRKFFINLNEKKLPNKRTFWKEIKPYLSYKGNISTNIMLLEKDEIVQKGKCC